MAQPDILKIKILAYDAQREMVHFGVNGWRSGKPVSISGAVALSLPGDPPASEVNAAAQEAVRNLFVDASVLFPLQHVEHDEGGSPSSPDEYF